MTLALALALALSAAAPDGGPAPDGGAPPALVTVTGTLAEVVYAERRLTVATEDGAVPLTYDRNTAVYLPSRLGTLRDLAPGQRIRAQRGADGRATWVEVRPSGEALPPAPPAARAPGVLPPPAPPDGGAPTPPR